MKIIFLNRFFYPDHSATSQMLSDLAFALADKGWNVRVITSRQRYDNPHADLRPRETLHGVHNHRVVTRRFGRSALGGRLLDYIGFYVSATWSLARYADCDTRVVAKTDPPLLSIPTAVICRLRGACLVSWLQDLFPEVATSLGVQGLQGFFGRLLQAWRNWSLDAAWRNVVIGEHMRDRLLAQGIEEQKLRVIYNWADGRAITPVAREDNLMRREWGLHEKLVVGYSGNLGRAHEIETLIGAAERLRNDRDIVFLFIGGGAYIETLKATAKEKGLRNLAFKPYQPRSRLALSLGVADVHLVILRPELEGTIVPSKYYGIAAAGRPTLFIGSAEGEFARHLRECDCGHTLAPGDAEALAGHIRELRDADKRVALGAKARASFEREYDFPIALARWYALLTDA